MDNNGDDESLLTLRLWTGPRSPPSAPSSSSSTTLPLETQVMPLPQPPSLPLDSIFQPVVPNLEAPSFPIVPVLSAPSPQPIPHDWIFQPLVPNQQAPSLSIYPNGRNHETHSPTGLDLNENAVPPAIVSHSRPPRPRRNTSQALRQGESNLITPPFPWATNQHATVHTLDYLVSHNITTISGEVQCKRCDRVYTINYDLLQKFRELSDYIKEHKFSLHDRAPPLWMNPTLPGCEACGSSVKPVVPEDKSSINWLFLLLGKMLGCCKLLELQYFCEHTNKHKTGAKDRVLYLTYLGLCNQLDPTGPFDT